MSNLSRRAFLASTGAAAGSAVLPAGSSEARDSQANHDQAIAVLYDATKCIGCRACMRACRQINNHEPELGEYGGEQFDMPTDLSAENWMVIRLYQEKQANEQTEPPPDQTSDGQQKQEPNWSFVKRNCMHCNVPACVSACPVGSLHKTAHGPVLYDEAKCIGCRYCILACPYNVPRYEWVHRAPKVRKCNWNRACVKACPTGALIEGARWELVAKAHERIRNEPDRYVNHVYGEHEVGGASYLILAGVEHEKLGLPVLPDAVQSSYAETLLHGLPGWALGLTLFLGALYQEGRRQQRVEAERAGAAEAAQERQADGGAS